MSGILPTEAEKAFIKQHLADDVRALALKIRPAGGLRIQYVLQQIAGYQAMRKKMPQWADTGGILYPVHLSIEQCSSAETAQYKARILERICNRIENFADLTSGFGVDFYVMSESADHAFYIERNEELCQIAEHNFSVLGRRNFKVLNHDGVDFIRQTDMHFSCIFLDPARRDSHGGKTFHIEDCEPNIVDFQDILMQKADYAIIKLSPMLDISECMLKLRNVSEIHIVAAGNECKEMLVVISGKDAVSCPKIFAKNDGQILEFTRATEGSAPYRIAGAVEPGMYLYEPNAAIMKAGAYRTLSERFDIEKIHTISHLYVSGELVDDFPGRRFQIVRLGSPKDFRGLKKANIAVRNYPMKPDELRKKMKLQDGGGVYLFATTISGGKKVVIECRKV